MNSLHIPLTHMVISLFLSSTVNYLTSNESYTDPFIVSSGYTMYSHYVYHHYTTLCDESVRSPFRFYIFACISFIYINNSHNEIIVSLHYGGCTHWFYYFKGVTVLQTHDVQYILTCTNYAQIKFRKWLLPQFTLDYNFACSLCAWKLVSQI